MIDLLARGPESKPNVYFIDDSATMREVVKIAFRRENFNVVTCADMASAVAQFDQAPPDAVINPTNGNFSWLPSGAAGTTTITVVVTDNGNPNKSTATTFAVIIMDLNVGTPTVETNGITLGWNAIPGLTYRLQFKNDLGDPIWTDLPGGDITATNSLTFTFDYGAATNGSRFYRLIALP